MEKIKHLTLKFDYFPAGSQSAGDCTKHSIFLTYEVIYQNLLSADSLVHNRQKQWGKNYNR